MKINFNFGFLDENTKKEIRRKILKAVAIPGHQIPFGSRELPIARGWGTGGIQITLSLLGKNDVVKVIDQGSDDSVNAVNIKKFLEKVSSVKTTINTTEATIIQTRHRIPEEPLSEKQIVVFQVPYPEPLRIIEPSEIQTRRMHAEADYSSMWLYLYETIIKYSEITIGASYPVIVNNRYMMAPSPIPRWDIPKLNRAKSLYLFGAGREKRIYAIPPYTDVQPIEFEDFKFRVEDFQNKECFECGSKNTFLNEIIEEKSGKRLWLCSDTSYCKKVKSGGLIEANNRN